MKVMTSLPLPTYHQLPHTRLRRQQNKIRKRITSHHRQKSSTSREQGSREHQSVTTNKSRACLGTPSPQCIRQALIFNGKAYCSAVKLYPDFCHFPLSKKGICLPSSPLILSLKPFSFSKFFKFSKVVFFLGCCLLHLTKCT